jgi:hypothetical protein
MKKYVAFGLVLAAALALFAQSTPAFALIVRGGGDGGGGGGGGTTLTPITATMELNQVFAGNTPDGIAPWLTATFASDVGATTGTLTLTSNLSASDFLQGLNDSNVTIGWAFFLDPVIDSISCKSGTCADNGVLFGGNYNSGPVPGGFNLAFGWSSFQAGDSAVYDLTFANALGGNPFVLNASNWSSVALVQGITGGCSGWIVSGSGTGADGSGACTVSPPQDVPEPAELGVFGLGVMLIGLFVGMRRRYS